MQPFTLTHLLLYFLKLGATGFGGPIALVGYMHQHLVEEKKWFTQEEYRHGLALSQLLPGPLAAQLAIYFGYLKNKLLGATLVAIAFILPSFLMVLGLSYLYVQYRGLPWISSIFYGMSAAVIGVVIATAYKITKISLSKNVGRWFVFLLLATVTIYFGKAYFFLFFLGGIISLAFHFVKTKSQTLTLVPLELFFFFFKTALIVYGGGMVIIAFIYNDVVNRFHWITDHQFLDAVSVGMITPGPVLITVAFVGYLASGLAGAVASAIGIFTPVYLLVILCAPWFSKIVKNEKAAIFVDGVTAAAAGAITGSVWILGRQAIVDWPTAIMALITLGFLIKTKIPAPVLILGSGLIGWILKNI